MTEFRKPKYLSPSALAKWEEVPDDAFVQYIVPKNIRPEREKQTGPMSVGSAFDALVKAALYQLFFGRDRAVADSYRIRDLVSSQCEEHTLPLALSIACDVFDQYVECGAYGNLVALIQQSSVEPRMEFDLIAEIGGVPLLGKPDLHFHTNLHCHVITDWKVSGSVSKHGVSAQQGYSMILDTQESRTHGKAHKRFEPKMSPCGILINGVPMNETTDYWADQLATYAWALGEAVGSEDFICRIEQLACRPCPATDNSGRLRVKCATHQSTVAPDYQKQLLERYQRVWSHIESGHYFSELTRSESDARADLIVRQLSQPADIASATHGTLPEINW